MVGKPFPSKAFCTLFLINRNPALYDSSLWLFVIRTPNGAAPAAHGVNKKVIQWFSGSQELVESTKTIS